MSRNAVPVILYLLRQASSREGCSRVHLGNARTSGSKGSGGVQVVGSPPPPAATPADAKGLAKSTSVRTLSSRKSFEFRPGSRSYTGLRIFCVVLYLAGAFWKRQY